MLYTSNTQWYFINQPLQQISSKEKVVQLDYDSNHGAHKVEAILHIQPATAFNKKSKHACLEVFHKSPTVPY